MASDRFAPMFPNVAPPGSCNQDKRYHGDAADNHGGGKQEKQTIHAARLHEHLCSRKGNRMLQTHTSPKRAGRCNVPRHLAPSRPQRCRKALPTGRSSMRSNLQPRPAKDSNCPDHQHESTPRPGIVSRTSPGKSSHCQPSTTNNSAAVATSTAHPIGAPRSRKHQRHRIHQR